MKKLKIKNWVVPNSWMKLWNENKITVLDMEADWCLYVESTEFLIGGHIEMLILPKNGREGFVLKDRFIANEEDGVATDYQIIYLRSGNIVKESKVLSKHLNISAVEAYKFLKKQLKKGFGEYHPLGYPLTLKVDLEAFGARVILRRRGDRGGYFKLKDGPAAASFRERYLLGKLKLWKFASKISLTLNKFREQKP